MEVDEFLTMDEVVARTTLSRSEIRRREARGSFPSRVRLGHRTVVYVAAEVRAWLERRAQEDRVVLAETSEETGP